MPKGSKKVAEVKQLQIHKEGHGTRDRNEMLIFFVKELISARERQLNFKNKAKKYKYCKTSTRY